MGAVRDDFDGLPLPPEWVCERSLVALEVPSERVEKHFGAPHRREESREGGASLTWGLRFACGLEVVLEAYEGGAWVNVTANAPEIDHILRHLALDVAPAYRGEGTPKNWEVWRQDDHGNRFIVAHSASERDASCLARELESRGHKQTYDVLGPD